MGDKENKVKEDIQRWKEKKDHVAEISRDIAKMDAPDRWPDPPESENGRKNESS